MSRQVALSLAVLAYLLTGWMVVAPGEVAVVYRLGAVDRTQTSGLGFRAPWPLEWDEQVDVETIRRVEPGQRRLLTGDTNLVELDLAIQYNISDVVAYLLSTDNPQGVVVSEVAGVAAEVVSAMDVDSLLTAGRAQVQRVVKEAAQARLDALGLGVRIASIEVRNLVPPSAVVDAFNDVSSAQGDRETLALAAESYSSELGPRIRGERAKMMEEARAVSTQRVSTAEAEIAHFKALQGQYRAAPEATEVELRNRLIHEMVKRVRVIAASEGSEIRLPDPQ